MKAMCNSAVKEEEIQTTTITSWEVEWRRRYTTITSWEVEWRRRYTTWWWWRYSTSGWWRRSYTSGWRRRRCYTSGWWRRWSTMRSETNKQGFDGVGVGFKSGLDLITSLWMSQ
jgi:hypothetical protein